MFCIVAMYIPSLNHHVYVDGGLTTSLCQPGLDSNTNFMLSSQPSDSFPQPEHELVPRGGPCLTKHSALLHSSWRCKCKTTLCTPHCSCLRQELSSRTLSSRCRMQTSTTGQHGA